MKLKFVVLSLLLLLPLSLVLSGDCDEGWVKCNDGHEGTWECESGFLTLGFCEASEYESSEDAAAEICKDHGGVKDYDACWR